MVRTHVRERVLRGQQGDRGSGAGAGRREGAAAGAVAHGTIRQGFTPTHARTHARQRCVSARPATCVVVAMGLAARIPYVHKVFLKKATVISGCAALKGGWRRMGGSASGAACSR